MIKEFDIGIIKNASSIEADQIEIGEGFEIGNNVRIKVRGKFKIGNYGHFGNDVRIEGEEVIIGDYFYHLTPNLRIGGGGSQFPDAKLVVGDRCVFHNNYINTCSGVYIGDDVGLSPDVDIITHGFWNSALEGYPYSYEPVIIGSGVIVGQRSFINVGAVIADNIVVGANSTVVGYLDTPKSIYAGCPAKFVKVIPEKGITEKEELTGFIIDKFISMCEYMRDFTPQIWWEYPLIRIGKVEIDLENKTLKGEEDNLSDMFRDYLRRYGIKIYTPRGFKSL